MSGSGLQAIESAASVSTPLLVKTQDLLVLLILMLSQTCFLYFHPEGKKNIKRPKLWPIDDVVLTLGSRICKCIHAILGCDTTSRLFGLGKSVSLNNCFVLSLLQ